MGTFADSWRLTKTTFRIIRNNTSLLWLPLLAGLSLLGVVALVAVPFVLLGGLGLLITLAQPGHGALILPVIVLALVVYFVLVFLGNFFTAALMAAAKLNLDGKPATVRDGLRLAGGRVGRLLVWSVIAATVGLAIQAIARRLGPLGGFLFRILAGATWGIATYFVLPTILFEDLGAWASLKRSASLFGQTFGKTLISNFVLAAIGVGLVLASFLLIVFGVVLVVSGAVVGGVAVLVLGVALLVFTIILMSAVNGILRVALYRYATTGLIDPGLRPANLPLPSA
ncbi:MAG: DUF6159 family protein [Thermoplasmata archaeon]|nr:DUF6159 family protein [Thermoplasmata archaeon]